jgi:hypothetical protein
MVRGDDGSGDRDGDGERRRPLPISALASSVMVPPGSSTPGRPTISAMTSPHGTGTAAAAGSTFSECRTAAAPAMTLTAT